MAFLDNSGDIILDAVLTDAGRFRLAKGDGSFKIVKFALSDDEINYRLYDKNDPSGSAYYDLEILQTPVFEAFTNNTSTMSYKLLSIPRTNLLYLPIIKINNNTTTNSMTKPQNNGFAVAVTNQTYNKFNVDASSTRGVMNGESPTANQMIRTDQGLDTTEISFQFTLDQDLKETQYIIEIDNRLGTVAAPGTDGADANVSFIDDDNIASYYLSTNDNDFVQDVKSLNSSTWSKAETTLPSSVAIIRGPQGTALTFVLKSTIDLVSSDFLFNQLGGDFTAFAAWGLSNTSTYKYIDTIVKITGATTGYRIDIPVRFVKCITNCNTLP